MKEEGKGRSQDGTDENGQDQPGIVHQLGGFQCQGKRDTQKGGDRYLNEGEREEVKPPGIYLHEDDLQREGDRAEKGEEVADVKLRPPGTGHETQAAQS